MLKNHVLLLTPDSFGWTETKWIVDLSLLENYVVDFRRQNRAKLWRWTGKNNGRHNLKRIMAPLRCRKRHNPGLWRCCIMASVRS